MTRELMAELCNADAIAANEEEIQTIIMKACGEPEFIDGLGSLIYHRSGKGPRVMLIAHMDEVGFIVKRMTPFGMLEVIPIGNVQESAKTFQKVRVTDINGHKHYGVLQKIQDINYIDLGLDSDVEIEELGISIGDMVTFDSEYFEMTNFRFSAKALDDRVGVYTLLKIMKEINTSDLDLYFVFSSSEEVGLRGGKTSADYVKPDKAIVIDVACARNEFQRDYDNTRQVGKGPMIVHYDKTMMPNRKMLHSIKRIAKEKHIPYQSDMFVKGGTDGGNVHISGTGCLTILLGIPNRYGHGSYSIGDYRDIDNLCSLIIAYLQEESSDTYGF